MYLLNSSFGFSFSIISVNCINYASIASQSSSNGTLFGLSNFDASPLPFKAIGKSSLRSVRTTSCVIENEIIWIISIKTVGPQRKLTHNCITPCIALATTHHRHVVNRTAVQLPVQIPVNYKIVFWVDMPGNQNGVYKRLHNGIVAFYMV